MTKHTPGPWRVDLRRSNASVVDASWHDLLRSLALTERERRANAQLQATSLDLYDAAVAVMRAHASELSGSPSFAALCEAVAKANGNHDQEM